MTKTTIMLTCADTTIEVDITDPAACLYRYVAPVASDWSTRPVLLATMYAGGWEPGEGIPPNGKDHA